MQATPTPVETSTVYVVSNSNEFRIWWNRRYCHWQTDIRSLRDVQSVHGGYLPANVDYFRYFGQASSLIQAMSNIAITL
jgi:hypothetical protein